MTSPATPMGSAPRHYGLVIRADDHGIVAGDRRAGNGVVTDRPQVVLIDFELGCGRPRHEATSFEEAFTIARTPVRVPAVQPVREDPAVSVDGTA